MIFREFRNEDVTQASKLLASRHKKEREVYPILKREFEDRSYTEKLLNEMMKTGYIIGVCAYEGNEMLGYILSNIKIDSVFGRYAWVSYEGLAISESETPELYRKLYAEIAKLWVSNGVLSHYVVVPAGYKEVIDSWLRLSFAFQQVYGITKILKSDINIHDDLIIRKAEKNDKETLREIANLIMSFQAGSPTYAPGLPEELDKIRDGYGELPNDEDASVLLAYKNNKLLGFQCAYKEDNSTQMMVPKKAIEIAVGGTIEECRGRGVGDILTRTMFNSALEENFETALADWRIANLSSSNFWTGKGFKPVAYRMCRRIDERVYWADGKHGLIKR